FAIRAARRSPWRARRLGRRRANSSTCFSSSISSAPKKRDRSPICRASRIFSTGSRSIARRPASRFGTPSKKADAHNCLDWIGRPLKLQSLSFGSRQGQGVRPVLPLMRVIVFASQKGGSGKTTLAGHIAVQAERTGNGPVALIDTDPQGSLAKWWNVREKNEP